jgi:hypothetical protein
MRQSIRRGSTREGEQHQELSMADTVKRGDERGKFWGSDDEPEHVSINLKNSKTLKRVSKPKLQHIAD